MYSHTLTHASASRNFTENNTKRTYPCMWQMCACRTIGRRCSISCCLYILDISANLTLSNWSVLVERHICESTHWLDNTYTFWWFIVCFGCVKVLTSICVVSTIVRHAQVHRDHVCRKQKTGREYTVYSKCPLGRYMARCRMESGDWYSVAFRHWRWLC